MQRYKLLACVLFASSWAHAQTVPSVLMISIDGMRPDYVTHAKEHGLKLPTLRSFMRDGVYADGVTGVFPTITYPSHTTLVTGVWPAQHGIVNNQRFDPEHKMGGAWYWYEDQIKVPTLWAAAHAAGLSTASVGWPVTADAQGIDTLIPEYWRANVGEPTNPDDRFLMNALSRPAGEVDRIARRTGTEYMQGNDTSAAGDEIKTAYALDILKQHKPKFMTVHLSSLDEEQHLHGPFSAEANADLERLDGMVGRLLAQERANDPRSTVVIVSDHGFAAIDQSFHLGVAFAESGLSTPPASPAEPALHTAQPVTTWLAQPWPLGSMFAIMLHSPEDAAVKQKVKDLLTQLAAQPENGIEDVLDAQQVAALGGPPEATFVVTLRKGYTTGTNVSGPLVTPISGRRGTHGYNPRTTPEMQSAFFLTGPGAAPGRDLGVVDMRRIAPTLANIMKLRLPRATEPSLPLH